MLITEILARNARMYTDKTALIERIPDQNLRKTITWQAFDQQADRVARALAARGIVKGDRVVHLMTNCIDWLPIYFGILRTGAWAVPLNFRFTAETIGTCVATAEAKAIFFGEEFIGRLAEIKPGLDKTVSSYIFVGEPAAQPPWAESFETVLAAPPAGRPPNRSSARRRGGTLFHLRDHRHAQGNPAHPP